MLHFQSLRLSGFKSFIEKTDLEIGPGLTGIVGPNGCGKSNLVEALRWTMGESSAKRMRGGGMEDVIFAGTERRPARNFAEVSLVLDNRTRSAPSSYNDSDEIEVIRKIVRDQGSAYRVNGKPARARDVQLLFADSLSGANSPSIVSQGRVAAIINAKPLERRMILEESAGISGLYARRHEAELRLKQAEQNLIRLEDMTGSMETRLGNLKRQARQAQKYKALNIEVRQLDQLIAYLEWKSGAERLVSLEKDYRLFEDNVAEQLATVTQLNKTYLTQSQDLPLLRENEAKSAAALQNSKLSLQRIEEQAEQLEQSINDTKAQLVQVEEDIGHSGNNLTEYQTTLTRMDEEQKKIINDEKHADGLIATRKEALEKCETSVSSLEENYNIMITDSAAAKAKRQSLERQVTQDQEQLERYHKRVETHQTRKQELEQQKEELGNLKEKEKAATKLEHKISDAKENLEKIEKALQATEEALISHKEEKQKIHLKNLEIESEIKSLKEFIDSFSNDNDAPVLDQVKAESGFETALSRALGDSLQASLEEDATSYWKTLKQKLPALPETVKPLKSVVKSPEALKNALSQIGLVQNIEDGQLIQNKLAPGQALVSKEGHYWRWDGYCIKPEAADSQSLFLKQKNKIESLETEQPEIQRELDKKEKLIADTEKKLSQQKEEHETALTSLKEIEDAYQTNENEISALKLKHESLNHELENLEQTIQDAHQDIELLTKTSAENKAQLKQLSEAEQTTKEDSIENMKSELDQARLDLQEAISALERVQQHQNSRKARLRAIADERVTLQNRIIRAQDHLKSQDTRKNQLQEKLSELSSRPQTMGDDQEELLNKLSKLETERQKFADLLQEKEQECNETARALKEAEASLSDVKEERARAQALFSSVQEQQDVTVQKIRDRFECAPQDLFKDLEISEEMNTDQLDELQQKRQKALRDREAIGPVNLQAETEATELENELGGMLHEKNDLVSAIEELRGGIKKLNDEARERLAVTFKHVDAHFQNLFKRLFVGGNAHLSLIESDDPLEAGLEIMAQPPGKALQALSLMSGGEQTLTSIALIFAMFLTNPAPICVLDEIDAPLDDANVDKVCDLLEEISETTKTRFLVVTHHRLTMARMHRIYGVTMAEKGVSQLISLDMQQSFAFLEEAA